MKTMKKKKKWILFVLAAILALSSFTFATDDENDRTVVYNLGTQDVTVDADADMPESDTHRLFDESGNYTIQLEDNAFFPYEVQFSFDGRTRVEIFDTPDSTVTVGDHVFGVTSAVTDENTLSQIGFMIGDDYIPAVPAAKTFTSQPDDRLRSLFPLETINVTVNLTGYAPGELKSVALSAVIGGMSPGQTVAPDAKVVWVKKAYAYEDDFKVAEQSEAIDLAPKYSGAASVILELIVGSGAQLDTANKRYIVTISITNTSVFTYSLYTQNGTARTSAYASTHETEGEFYDSVTQSVKEVKVLDMSVSPQHKSDTEFYFGMSKANAFTADVAVYRGFYETAEAAIASGQAVTGSVLNQTMTDMNAGLAGRYADHENPQFFTVVYSRADAVTGFDSFMLDVRSRGSWVEPIGLFESTTQVDDEYYDYDYDEVNDIEIITFILKKAYPATGSYALGMKYYHANQTTGTAVAAGYVDKAVVGHFDTLAAAANATDIKDKLFADAPAKYHIAKYSGAGQKFTVFAEGEVYKFTIKAMDGGEEPQYEDPLEADVNFQVNGVKSGNDELNTFVVEAGDLDTYYSKGYQTVLVSDSAVNMAALKPLFWVYDGVKAYAGTDGAEEQTSGTSEQDFSNGSVMYTAKAANGRTIKNYKVTFVKKASGAKLFVNGPTDDASDPREVFLNDAYENRHDIFIANVGDAELTGLTLALNATHVKLDDYWRVGNDPKNTTLAAFTSTNDNDMWNVAKIRLLPDGNGAISGTLTISSTNGGTRVVHLTGLAGNPQIITTSLRDGIKYVPYSRMIQTNNMDDRNTVTFSLRSGALPEGLTLRPSGEIYGAPKKAGTFTFTVRADYSYAAFKPSTATYTLTVKENTDPNVNAETDAGYEILTRVPATVNTTSDQVFRIAGGIGDYQDFWFDGVKMVEGTHYTVEDGSTKITIKGQTFNDAGAGTHTIAAEFRVGGSLDNEMKKAAQNLTVQRGNGGNGGGGGGGGSSSGNTTSGTSSTGTGTAPGETSKSVVDIFNDLTGGAWYVGDVQWAYDQGYMVGTGNAKFEPNAQQTQATIFSVLARIADVNLFDYADKTSTEIQAGQWYTNAAQWAKSVGLTVRPFDPNAAVSRADMAVILAKYLKWLGVDISTDEAALVIADAGLMTKEQKEAFTTLYKIGIFTGVDRTAVRMNPTGITSRAELAALLHRLSAYITTHKPA